MANREYDQSMWERDRDMHMRSGRDEREDRGWFDRAGDEVRSWFGDDDAERRRRMDERNEAWRDRYDYDNGSDYRHNYGRYEYDSDRVRRDLDRGNDDRSYNRGGYGGDAGRRNDRDWHNQESLNERYRNREQGLYGNRGWEGDRGGNWNGDRGWDDRNWNGDRNRNIDRSRDAERNWNGDRGMGSYQQGENRNWNGNTAYQGYGGDYERFDRSSYGDLNNYGSGREMRHGDRDRNDGAEGRRHFGENDRRDGRMW